MNNLLPEATVRKTGIMAWLKTNKQIKVVGSIQIKYRKSNKTMMFLNHFLN